MKSKLLIAVIWFSISIGVWFSLTRFAGIQFTETDILLSVGSGIIVAIFLVLWDPLK